MIDMLRDRVGGRADLPALKLPDQHLLRYAHKRRAPSARQRRDEQLKVEIRRVWDANYQVYGPARAGGSCSEKASRWPAAPWSG
jgi:hypothetical protein